MGAVCGRFVQVVQVPPIRIQGERIQVLESIRMRNASQDRIRPMCQVIRSCQAFAIGKLAPISLLLEVATPELLFCAEVLR